MAQFHRARAGIDHLERLSRGDSPLHRMNAGAKGAVTLLCVALVISFPSRNLRGLLAFCLYPAVFMSLSGTPWKPLLARLATALPFALMGGVSNLVFQREAVFVAGNFTVTLGMVSFASILLKTVFSVLAVLILIATTSFGDLAALLTAPRAFRVIGLQIVMTWRYISTLLDEAQDMVMAYSLRAPGAKGIRMRDMGPFAGQLLLRSFDRAGRVYAAMKCRGFSGFYRGNRPAALRRRDWLYMMGTGAALLFLRFVNLSRIFGALRFF